MAEGELRAKVEAALTEALDTFEAFRDDVTDRATEALTQGVTKLRDACNDFLAEGEAAPDAPPVATQLPADAGTDEAEG